MLYPAIPFDLWQARLGPQRDWIWRGWQIRYCFLHPRREPVGPPLLFVHGFGAAIEHWRYNLAVFAEHHPVYALDLLGFGASRKAATNYSAYLWAEQLHDFWQTFIGEPTVLVGNSLGSLVSLTAATTYPEMARGLALVNIPDFVPRSQAIPRVLRSLVSGLESAIANPLVLKILYRIVRRPSFLRRVLRRAAYRRWENVDADLVQMVSAPPHDGGAFGAFVALSRSARAPNYAPETRQLLAQVTVPILLVWGTRDGIVSFNKARHLIELNPRLTFISLEGLGHCPQDEAPEQFNPILREWLATHARRSDRRRSSRGNGALW